MNARQIRKRKGKEERKDSKNEMEKKEEILRGKTTTKKTDNR